MGKTSIEWTDETWNPVVGCDQISPGCANCYAKRIAERFAGLNGFPAVDPFQVVLHPERLAAPLHWWKPRMVFVNSMSDLFHDDVPFDFIDEVFAVMAMTPQHTYQVLTKRPERMLEYMKPPEGYTSRFGPVAEQMGDRGWRSEEELWNIAPPGSIVPKDPPWPLPNVWLGTSVENQRWANERLPILEQVPAAVRFVSFEPLLGAMNLSQWLKHPWVCEFCHKTARGDQPLPSDWDWAWQSAICPDCRPRVAADGGYGIVKGGAYATIPDPRPWRPGIHWAIVGGESGPGARPMRTDWARSLVDQLKDTGTPVFVKQMGSVWAKEHKADSKGGNRDFWPEDLRVRQMPQRAAR